MGQNNSIVSWMTQKQKQKGQEDTCLVRSGPSSGTLDGHDRIELACGAHPARKFFDALLPGADRRDRGEFVARDDAVYRYWPAIHLE